MILIHRYIAIATITNLAWQKKQKKQLNQEKKAEKQVWWESPWVWEKASQILAPRLPSLEAPSTWYAEVATPKRKSGGKSLRLTLPHTSLVAFVMAGGNGGCGGGSSCRCGLFIEGRAQGRGTSEHGVCWFSWFWVPSGAYTHVTPKLPRPSHLPSLNHQINNSLSWVHL